MLNKFIAGILPFLPKRFVWLFSRRYIAGDNLNDALNESIKLNKEGIGVTVDILGEYIQELSEAEKNKEQYIKLIKRFLKSEVIGYFSLKPSMFGLLIDKGKCYENIRDIVSIAFEKNSFVRIDMEDSTCTDDELDLFIKLKEEFPGSVGIVLQSYLRRTYYDLKKLAELHDIDNPLNVRLCKGIYIESEDIAYKNDSEIRDWFVREVEYMFKEKIYIGIATHDKYLVERAKDLIEKYNVPKDMYEFQMLFGVTPELRRTIVSAGHPMRVYVPFGKEWFGYSTRRLKENPNMATYIVKALFVRG
jgi:proline dehydrogenase